MTPDSRNGQCGVSPVIFVHVGFSVLVWIEVDVSFPQFDCVWECMGSVCGIWECMAHCICVGGCGGTCQRKTSGVLLCHCTVFL